MTDFEKYLKTKGIIKSLGGLDYLIYEPNAPKGMGAPRNWKIAEGDSYDDPTTFVSRDKLIELVRGKL